MFDKTKQNVSPCHHVNVISIEISMYLVSLANNMSNTLNYPTNID